MKGENNMYQLICMSFDGEYQLERYEFESIDDAWEYSNNLGSKWYFYPFHFVIENKVIKDTPMHLEFFKERSIVKVCKVFNRLSKKPECEGIDTDSYICVIIDDQLYGERQNGN
jgi:hypothetical protein